jgi:hypothetical protein
MNTINNEGTLQIRKWPTDEELDELWDEEGSYFNLYPEVRRTIRAALARWGS